MVPGTAIFFLAISSRENFCFATSIGRSRAHARAAWQERVFVGNIGVGMDADGGDVEFAARGALVERLDVLRMCWN
ncbi:MAG: hypothetical protein WDM80_18615 [Limisphaerales bacterium]